MKAILIYPHQLYENHPCLTGGVAASIYLVEEPLIYGCDSKWKIPHHVRRQALLREAGTKYIKSQKKKINLIGLDGFKKNEKLSTSKMLGKLPKNISEIHLARVVDDLLERRITAWAEKKDVEIVWYETPNFLSPDDWWQGYFSDKKKPLMHHFYQAQRKRMSILVDDGNKPVGGSWSYDSENRKKLPKNYQEPPLPKCTPFSKDTITWVNKHFPKDESIGEIDESTQGMPQTHEEAKKWLESFLTERFDLFGDYEDALSTRYSTQQHSLLTPMLNIGLLEPQYIVDRAVEYAKENDVPLNSLEGFLRQIIGWREFMRCMYERHGRTMRCENFWGFEQDVPKAFYTGRTGIPPVDDVIKKLIDTGYCHHIERLMVMGVMFQLCHIKPDAVYRWFMEFFIDAYDWVMVPNVYGMSQFADGGKFVTKPYVCGSNYIRKMSDYPKGEWCDIWDGLFWDFINTNKEFYINQPRLGMMTRQLDKMSAEKLENHKKHAAHFREKMHSGWECDEFSMNGE